MSDESRVVELAAAVLDGTAIDWTSEQSSSDAAPSSLLNHLQVVAAIADLHRSAADALDSRPVPRVHPGGQWGHLRLLECIARGAFGEVYRAWDTRLDREVALKLLPAAGVSTERGASSIIHEGRLLARVRHPNVVTIYGAEQIDDRIGLWMEYVRGRTLEQILKQGATFTATETARVGAEICKAISAVHAAGLLHRDIKAQNVMLADDGRVVLMDFGAGREFDDGAATDLAGTPLYLAPEVFRGQRATAQSDIYSLGVLLFHLVSRGYPVHARTTADLRLAHERGVRTPLRATRGEVPAALVRVIDRAMHPVPTLRYGTAAELGRALVALNRRSRTLPAFYAGVALATALLVVSVPLARPGRFPSPRIAHAGTHPAIAVLPFKNLSAGAGNEEFADGLTYEIHRNLAGIHGLELRSSTSSFSFRGARRLSDIREQLGADYVLEGSILRSPGTIRVQVRFARVADDTTVWAAKYDRSPRDIFAIQDEISLEIVNALRLKVGRGQRRYEIDPDVYYQFLKARGLRSRRDPEDAARAAALFEAIVARDPAFAPAWSALASAIADATRHQPREEMPTDRSTNGDRRAQRHPDRSAPGRSTRSDGECLRAQSRLGERAKVVRDGVGTQSQSDHDLHRLRSFDPLADGQEHRVGPAGSRPRAVWIRSRWTYADYSRTCW